MQISEQKLKASFVNFDWAALARHFEELEFDDAVLEVALGHATRHTGWICKYPDKKIERKRAAFFGAFSAYVEQRLGREQSQRVNEIVELIGLVERGYREIAAIIDQTDIGKKAPDIRAWSMISRACSEYELVESFHQAALAQATQVNLAQGVRPRDADGKEFSMDAALEGLADGVRLTLQMEAFKNGWFNERDELVLPEPPLIDDVLRFQAGSTQVLAAHWRHWTHLERRRRYLGGRLDVRRGEVIPEPLRSQIKSWIVYEPDETSGRELFDYFANQRLKHRFAQNLMEIRIQLGASGTGVGSRHGAALPTEQLVSEIEGHALVALSEMLGYLVTDDDDDSSGLRLLHWVRGYAVLHDLARENIRRVSTSDRWQVIMDEAQLVGILQSCGLEGAVANVFVSLVCLHRSSRDMFDCPLVRLENGKILLFAPPVLALNIPLAVLSNISTRQGQIGRKGAAFEKATREMLAERGLQPRAFKFRRGVEEYEYDAVVPFESHIFIFECKNFTLSGGEPSEIYHFDLAISSQARQVKRLAAALERHSDIVAEQLGPEHVGKPIVPCVLHSLPYSRPGPVDGVYFTDFSALGRFFAERHLRIVVPHFIGDARILHRIAIRDVWGGDRPSAQGLIAMLDNPPQIELLMRFVDFAQFDFQAGLDTVVTTQDLMLQPMTSESVCKAFGIPSEAVEKEISDIAKEARRLRQSLAAPTDKS